MPSYLQLLIPTFHSLFLSKRLLPQNTSSWLLGFLHHLFSSDSLCLHLSLSLLLLLSLSLCLSVCLCICLSLFPPLCLSPSLHPLVLKEADFFFSWLRAQLPSPRLYKPISVSRPSPVMWQSPSRCHWATRCTFPFLPLGCGPTKAPKAFTPIPWSLFSGAKDGTQGCVQARQTLYHSAPPVASLKLLQPPQEPLASSCGCASLSAMRTQSSRA